MSALDNMHRDDLIALIGVLRHDIADMRSSSASCPGDPGCTCPCHTAAADGGGPNLGLATTAQVLDELRARIDTDYASGGGGLGYTSVHGRPGLAP